VWGQEVNLSTIDNDSIQSGEESKTTHHQAERGFFTSSSFQLDQSQIPGTPSRIARLSVITSRPNTAAWQDESQRDALQMALVAPHAWRYLERQSYCKEL
jgi:hypothetical protein